MSINVDWEKLRAIYQELIDNHGLVPESDITFTLVLTDGKAKKSIVKFKDFMSFFWAISESKELNIITLLAQDKEGRILYRYKQRTNGDEEIPDGGHAGVIQNWNAFTPEEKEIYLSILLAQIYGYER
jgi:hypothetical protein